LTKVLDSQEDLDQKETEEVKMPTLSELAEEESNVNSPVLKPTTIEKKKESLRVQIAQSQKAAKLIEANLKNLASPATNPRKNPLITRKLSDKKLSIALPLSARNERSPTKIIPISANLKKIQSPQPLLGKQTSIVTPPLKIIRSNSKGIVDEQTSIALATPHAHQETTWKLVSSSTLKPENFLQPLPIASSGDSRLSPNEPSGNSIRKSLLAIDDQERLTSNKSRINIDKQYNHFFSGQDAEQNEGSKANLDETPTYKKRVSIGARRHSVHEVLLKLEAFSQENQDIVYERLLMMRTARNSSTSRAPL